MIRPKKFHVKDIVFFFKDFNGYRFNNSVSCDDLISYLAQNCGREFFCQETLHDLVKKCIVSQLPWVDKIVVPELVNSGTRRIKQIQSYVEQLTKDYGESHYLKPIPARDSYAPIYGPKLSWDHGFSGTEIDAMLREDFEKIMRQGDGLARTPGTSSREYHKGLEGRVTIQTGNRYWRSVNVDEVAERRGLIRKIVSTSKYTRNI